MSDQVTAMTAANSAANIALLASVGKGVADTQASLAPTLTELRRGIEDLKQGQQLQAKAISDQLISLKSGSEALPTCKDLKQVADRSANSGYWDDAVSGYRDFLSNPSCASDPKLSEVQFSIAESYFGWKKYDLAVQEYDIFLQKFPPNDKTASALLRKGLAHAELKQTTDARAALTRVTKEFPGTGEAANAAAKLKDLGTAPAPAAPGRGR
jgi:TolA-binding protein